MTIYLDNRCSEQLPEAEYTALAEYVLQAEQALPESELSISLVSVQEIHELNRQYRGIDAPTDVLAFENDGELLGDVVLCPAIAREHAQDFDSDFNSEMELMLTHAILHLCGYDHQNDEEAEAMEARENELLDAWRSP